jgi:mannose-6-phosphate isomerase-like protein (cupin superfamily)
MFDNALGWQGITQQVWLRDGQLEMQVGNEVTLLQAGDCLFMRLDQPITFHNPGTISAHYAVILSRL